VGGPYRHFYGTISSLAHILAPGHFAVAMNWAEENPPPHPASTLLYSIIPLSYNNYYSQSPSSGCAYKTEDKSSNLASQSSLLKLDS
jgi:hypothetical protein